jgi:hypothetical protein
MSIESDQPTPRREFLGQIAASAIVLAGTACATPSAAPQTAPAPASPKSVAAGAGQAPPQPTHWDDSWFARLTAKHKAVFDMPEVDEGIAIAHAALWLRGTHDAVGSAYTDMQAVIVIRHAGVIVAFNDAMWAKYELGKEQKVKDEATGKWAVRNPFASPAPRNASDSTARPNNPDRPGSNLAWFAQNGHVLLACDLATRGMSQIIAKKVKGDERTIYEELKANLVAGVILQPSGIYAVHRAQEAGCTVSG